MRTLIVSVSSSLPDLLSLWRLLRGSFVGVDWLWLVHFGQSITQTDIVVGTARNFERFCLIKSCNEARLSGKSWVFGTWYWWGYLSAQLGKLIWTPREKLVVFGEHNNMIQAAINCLTSFWEGRFATRHRNWLKNVVWVWIHPTLPFIIGTPRVDISARWQSNREVFAHFQLLDLGGSCEDLGRFLCIRCGTSPSWHCWRIWRISFKTVLEGNVGWFLVQALFNHFLSLRTSTWHFSVKTPNENISISCDTSWMTQPTRYGLDGHSSKARRICSSLFAVRCYRILPILRLGSVEKFDESESWQRFFIPVAKSICASIATWEHSMHICSNEGVNCATSDLFNPFSWLEKEHFKVNLLFFRVFCIHKRISVRRLIILLPAFVIHTGSQINRFWRFEFFEICIENAFACTITQGLPLGVERSSIWGWNRIWYCWLPISRLARIFGQLLWSWLENWRWV